MLRRPVLRTGSSKQSCNLEQYLGQAHALSRKLYHMLYTFTRRAVGFEASGAELETVYVRTISITDELSICDFEILQAELHTTAHGGSGDYERDQR